MAKVAKSLLRQGASARASHASPSGIDTDCACKNRPPHSPRSPEIPRTDIMPIFTIDALSMDGRGIVRHGENGKTTFVSGALPGDRVEVTITREHKGYCEGRVTALVERARNTIEPSCPHWHECGGCSLQRLPYDAQLAAKEQFVRETLTRIGKIPNPPLRPIVASPDVFGYRNRVQLAFARNDEGKIHLGMRMPQSHLVVPAKGCRLLACGAEEIVQTVEDLANRADLSVYDPGPSDRARNRGRGSTAKKGFLRFCQIRQGRVPDDASLASAGHVPEQRAFWLVFLTSPGSRKERATLARVATEILLACPTVHAVIHEERTSEDMLVRGEKRIFAMARPDFGLDPALMLMPLGDKGFLVDAADFFQVNTRAAGLLAREAAALALKAPLLDLYCGVGAPGLLFGEEEITGVEYSASSIAMARKNAARMGRKASYHAGDAAKILQTGPLRGAKPVQVLCDPPRAGLDNRVVSWLLDKRPQHIIYISCNPATLARDVLALQKAYTLEQTIPVDMFPQTPHVETLVLMSSSEQ